MKRFFWVFFCDSVIDRNLIIFMRVKYINGRNEVFGGMYGVKIGSNLG